MKLKPSITDIYSSLLQLFRLLILVIPWLSHNRSQDASKYSKTFESSYTNLKNRYLHR